MNLSQKSEKELIEASQSGLLRHDIETIASQRHNPFIKDGKADVDSYIDFITQFNEFINHEPRPFMRIAEREMKL